MRICVIGTNGFLSTALVRGARERGHYVSAWGIDMPRGYECHLFRRIDLTDASFDFAQLAEFDLVLYAAGAGIQANRRERPELIYNLNVLVPVRICCALRDSGFKGHLVTFGSYFELGPVLGSKLSTEKDVISACACSSGDYIESKRMLTRFASSVLLPYTYWHFILPTIYGPGESHIRLIPTVVAAAVNRTPVSFTSGAQVRQYVYVGEIVRLVFQACEADLPSGVYNAAGNETLSVREIVMRIFERYGASLPNGCFGRLARSDTGMHYLALDGSELKRRIKYNPTQTILETLDEYMEWNLCQKQKN